MPQRSALPLPHGYSAYDLCLFTGFFVDSFEVLEFDGRVKRLAVHLPCAEFHCFSLQHHNWP